MWDVTPLMKGSFSISFATSSVNGRLCRHGQLSCDPLHDWISFGHFVMKNVLGPAAAMLLETPALMPCTAADITVTTNTPTAMPRIVSPARTLFERIASSAITTPSKRLASLFTLSSRAKRGICSCGSFLSHGENRIQLRRATRGICAGNDPDACTDADREDEGPRRDRCRQRGPRRYRLRQSDAECDAKRRAHHTEGGRLHQELRQDVA